MVERFPTCNPRQAAANESAWLALGAPGLSFQDRGVGRLQNSRHLEAVLWILAVAEHGAVGDGVMGSGVP